MLPALGLLLASLCVSADWHATGADGYLEFVPIYDGTELPGRFRQFEVSLEPGAQSPAGGHLEVLVHVDSADLEDADLNEGIAGADFFHFAGFPLAVFASTSILPAQGDGHFVALGLLELKGRSREIRVPFVWREAGGQVEMSGNLEVSRRAFGIGEGEWATDDTIADRVAVRFRLSLHATP